MKIVEIRESDDSIYTVRFKPNWFERIFGIVEHEEQYKSTNQIYANTGVGVYLRKDGRELSIFNPIGKAIDNFKRKW